VKTNPPFLFKAGNSQGMFVNLKCPADNAFEMPFGIAQLQALEMKLRLAIYFLGFWSLNRWRLNILLKSKGGRNVLIIGRMKWRGVIRPWN